MEKNASIYVAGHGGMVGSALVRQLKEKGYSSILTADRGQLDLLKQSDVNAFFTQHKPEYVFIAAAKVGGIMANNTYRADFLMENLLIETNIIRAAHQQGVKKLLFLGSSCIYPKEAPQPLKEEYLLTGPLEQTNEPYAIAKIAGLKLCEAYYEQYGNHFFSVMPTNLYGPYDNFSLTGSHVLPALMMKMHQAKLTGVDHVELWGTGKPLREFLHVDDLASACLFLMEGEHQPRWMNIGSGEEVSIAELAEIIRDVVGFEGSFTFNSNYPDGTMRKLLDSSVINALGWQKHYKLREGIQQTYNWFLNNQEQLRT